MKYAIIRTTNMRKYFGDNWNANLTIYDYTPSYESVYVPLEAFIEEHPHVLLELVEGKINVQDSKWSDTE
jgi:hypothetical protein